MKLYASAAALMLTLVSGSAQAAPPYQYGPEPDWARYKALAEPAVLAAMPDPQNWAVEWPNGFMKDYWKKDGRQYGYVTCGSLRAIVPPEKGPALRNFVVVVDYDQVKAVDLRSHERNSLINLACAEFAAMGRLPPARFLEDAQSRRATGPWGFEVRALAEGAYVTKVAPGSLAAKVGLLPGMVIAEANEVRLAGVGSGMTQAFMANPASLQLRTVGGQTFKLVQAK